MQESKMPLIHKNGKYHQAMARFRIKMHCSSVVFGIFLKEFITNSCPVGQISTLCSDPIVKEIVRLRVKRLIIMGAMNINEAICRPLKWSMKQSHGYGLDQSSKKNDRIRQLNKA